MNPIEPPTAALKIPDLIEDFGSSLRAANKRPKTVRSYTDAVRFYCAWAEQTGHSVTAAGPGQAERSDHEAYITYEIETHSAATASAYFKGLQAFWKWVVEVEGEREDSPIAKMSAPKVPAKIRPVFTDDEVQALLGTCHTHSFNDRRDAAIMRMFRANGVRVEGMMSMRLDRINRKDKEVAIVLKGGDEEWVPFTDKADAALGRYLRERRKHPFAHLPYLWLGKQGRLTVTGVQQMLKRRGAEANIVGAHPHKFRHTVADHLISQEGISDQAAMDIFHWKTHEMVGHYAADGRKRRARAAFHRIDIDGGT